MERDVQLGDMNDAAKAQAIIDATENMNCSVNFAPSRVLVIG